MFHRPGSSAWVFGVCVLFVCVGQSYYMFFVRQSGIITVFFSISE